MMLLKIASFFVLVEVIVCLTYADIAGDECFKKIYVCGEYRMIVTTETGRLETEPSRFSEICRKHKEFIACVEEAADFCSGKLTNITTMILDNRRSLKLFCLDLEWKKNYFSSAQCLNENEKVVDECIQEEVEYEDDGPPWCFIPEPCESLERVFSCAVQKIKSFCGAIAAEVYRRMHILKMENRDVVCKIRSRNPLTCRYERKRESITGFVKRIGSMSIEVKEAIDQVFSNTLVKTLDSFTRVLHNSIILEAFGSELYGSTNDFYTKEVEGKYGAYLKKCKLPTPEWAQIHEFKTERIKIPFQNIKILLANATSQSSKFGSAFYENLLKSCGTENIYLESCLRKLNELEVLKSFNPVARISEELNRQLKFLREYFTDILEFPTCYDGSFNAIREDSAVVSWYFNRLVFPLRTLSCEWKDEENTKVFQCFLKMKPYPFAITPADAELTLDRSEEEDDFLGSSVFTESGSGEEDFVPSQFRDSESGVASDFIVPSMYTDSGSGEAGDSIVSTDEQVSLVSSAIDTSDAKFDIHRSGEQVMLLKTMGSGDIEEHSMKETYILVDPTYSPIDSVSYLMDSSLKAENSYLDSVESFPSYVISETPESIDEVDFDETVMKENLKLQLEKIVNALNL